MHTVQVAAQALDIVEGLSGSDEGLAALRPVCPALSKQLLRCSADASLSRSALTALVNICQDSAMRASLIDAGATATLLDYVHEGTTVHTDLVVMALSNLTQPEDGAKAALQVCPASALMHTVRACGPGIVACHAPGL